MMRRDTLLALRTAVKHHHPPVIDPHDIRNMIESHLEALDRIEGGQTEAERTKQLTLALSDLRAVLNEVLDNVPADVEPAVIEGEPLIRDLQKGVYVLDMIDEMLGAKLRNRKKWSWYSERIDEEFGS